MDITKESETLPTTQSPAPSSETRSTENSLRHSGMSTVEIPLERQLPTQSPTIQSPTTNLGPTYENEPRGISSSTLSVEKTENELGVLPGPDLDTLSGADVAPSHKPHSDLIKLLKRTKILASNPFPDSQFAAAQTESDVKSDSVDGAAPSNTFFQRGMDRVSALPLEWRCWLWVVQWFAIWWIQSAMEPAQKVDDATAGLIRTLFGYVTGVVAWVVFCNVWIFYHIILCLQILLTLSLTNEIHSISSAAFSVFATLSKLFIR
jgi:hypothetical protein